MAKDQYGNEITEEMREFHKNRTMFAFCGSVLTTISNTDQSHMDWFMERGWIKSIDDPVFEHIIRGYFNLTGIYFYKGVHFTRDDDLDEFIRRNLNLLTDAYRSRFGECNHVPVFSGMKTEGGSYWPIKLVTVINPSSEEVQG